MRVALVYPEALDLARFREKRKEFPPFGALYLAAVTEKAGYDVTVFKVDNGAGLDLRDAVAFTIPSSATMASSRTAGRPAAMAAIR
jgi:hypothetical protein